MGLTGLGSFRSHNIRDLWRHPQDSEEEEGTIGRSLDLVRLLTIPITLILGTITLVTK